MVTNDRPIRQLCVLLFTDVVGSTAQRQRLGELAADELRATIDEVQHDVISTNGGAIVKHTGDGMMATFESVTSALRCAAGLQIELARLNASLVDPVAMRVGVAAGEVTSHAGDYFGMPVVVAARLCDACHDGEVLASDLVKHLTAGDTTNVLADPVELQLKGLDDVVVAWHLRWDASETPAPLPPALRRDSRFAFVGRNAEWDELISCWSRVQMGNCHVALVMGPPGIGKTRLVAEFADFARAGGATVLFGRNDEGLSVPYEPFAEAFRQYVHEQPGWALPRRLGASRGELVRLLPELGDIIEHLPAPVKSDAQTERFRLFEAIVQWLSAASSGGPIVLVLDDLQWAAAQTVQLIRHVGLASTPMSVLILGTARAGVADAAGIVSSLQLPADRLTCLELSGFDDATTHEFLEAAAGHDLGSEGRRVSALLHEQTRGNPFFCRELALHLLETGSLTNVDGRWQVASHFGSFGVPDSIRTTVIERVGRLSATSRDVLVRASVIGLEIDVPLLEAVADVDEDTLLAVLEECSAANVLEELGLDRFQFTHALVRAALYESIGETRRVRLHRRVADELESQSAAGRTVRLGELAHHFAEGARDDDVARAVEYCRRAAGQAMAQLAYDEAEQLYRRAVELIDRFPPSAPFDPSERCDLLTDLATSSLRAGDPDYGPLFASATEAAEALGDPHRMAAVLLAGSRGAATITGSVEFERVARLRNVLTLLPVTDDPERAKLLANLATELQFTGDIDEVMAVSEQALSMARRLGDPATLMYVLMQRVGAIRLADVLDEQLADLVELGRLSRELGDPQSEFFAAYRAADAYLQLADLAGFRAAVADAQRLCPLLGQPALELRAMRLAEESAWLEGDLDTAERVLDAIWTLGTELGVEDQIVASFGGGIAKVLAARGRPEHGVPWYERLAAFSHVEGFRAGLAVILEQSGEVERARQIYDELMQADVSTLAMNITRVHTLCFLASLCATFDDGSRAEPIERELLKYRDIWVVAGSNSYGPTTQFLARLADAQGRYDEADRLYQDADDRCVSMQAPLMRAWNQVAWAGSIIDRGPSANVEFASGLIAAAAEQAAARGACGIERAADGLRAALDRAEAG